MARFFDASNNDYIEIGDVPDLDLTGDVVSLSVWIRLTSVNGEMKILAKWSDSPDQKQYLLSITASDKVQIAINAGGVSTAIGTTSVMVAGIWCHIVGTYDGSNMRIYLNGIEENSAAKTGNMPSTTAPVRIGAGSGGAGTEQPFDGEIGHCGIWNIPLSADDVASLANGFPLKQLRPDNLVSYPPLNGKSPEPDVVGGFNTTVVGTTVGEEPPNVFRPIIAP